MGKPKWDTLALCNCAILVTLCFVQSIYCSTVTLKDGKFYTITSAATNKVF